MSTIKEVVENYLCSGCGTCNVICNQSAIKMEFNSIGQLLPMIDSQKCIDCGLCYDYCPSLDKKRIVHSLLHDDTNLYGDILGTYIGKSTDEIIYRNSQSGGVATAILTYLFDNGLIDAAIVCHVEYANEYQSKAIIVTNKHDLLKCQKSSYSPVDMVSAVKEANSYHSVAFVGTGCHIQGVRTLQSFRNGKKYSNIKYLIGLICDRTLCKTATDVLYNNHSKGKKKKLIWRDKSVNYKNAKLLIEEESGKKKEVPSWKRHYLKEYFTAPRCMICFDKFNLGADIVLGDPWGVQDVDWTNGESLVLCRTSLGQTVIDDMIQRSNVVLRQVEPYQALKGQAIDKRLSLIRKNMLLFKQKGWLLPHYSDVFLSGATEQLTSLENGQMDNFCRDSMKSKKEIVSKYIWQLRLLSLKKKIYKFYSIINR